MVTPILHIRIIATKVELSDQQFRDGAADAVPADEDSDNEVDRQQNSEPPNAV